MPSMDDTEEVRDGVGRQPGPNRGEQVESVVRIGQFGIADGRSAGLAKCADLPTYAVG